VLESGPYTDLSSPFAPLQLLSPIPTSFIAQRLQVMSRRVMNSLLRIRSPDDMNIHLRDGPMMAALLQRLCSVSVESHSQSSEMPRVTKRAIIMPNLKPPISTVEQVRLFSLCFSLS
jgi:hypothetical protein